MSGHKTILEALGWTSDFEASFRQMNWLDLFPARITRQSRSGFQVRGIYGETVATLTKKVSRLEVPFSPSPAVGDWVAIRLLKGDQSAVIEAVLPRKTRLSRQISGGRGRRSGGATAEQVIAANVDIVFIVASLDGSRNLNPNMIERYITLTGGSGASPVIILNKMDLCTDLSHRLAVVENVAMTVPVVPLSATKGIGLDNLKQHLLYGLTAVFIGPSGVGKSSIINALLGTERLLVGEVRETDFRGRHTTISRELIVLPDGGVVIDTPGMREIQLWVDEGDLTGAFPEIARLASECRFRDCAHQQEPGCAVKQAIEDGTLDPRRLDNYRKMEREIQHLEARQNDRVRVEEKQKWKKISQWQKNQRRYDI